MSTTLTRTRAGVGKDDEAEDAAGRPATARRAPWPHRAATALRRALTGGAALLWTALVVVPVYWLVVTSLRSGTDFTTASPLAPPATPPWRTTGPSWTATSRPICSTAPS